MLSGGCVPAIALPVELSEVGENTWEPQFESEEICLRMFSADGVFSSYDRDDPDRNQRAEEDLIQSLEDQRVLVNAQLEQLHNNCTDNSAYLDPFNAMAPEDVNDLAIPGRQILAPCVGALLAVYERDPRLSRTLMVPVAVAEDLLSTEATAVEENGLLYGWIPAHLARLQRRLQDFTRVVWVFRTTVGDDSEGDGHFVLGVVELRRDRAGGPSIRMWDALGSHSLHHRVKLDTKLVMQKMDSWIRHCFKYDRQPKDLTKKGKVRQGGDHIVQQHKKVQHGSGECGVLVVWLACTVGAAHRVPEVCRCLADYWMRGKTATAEEDAGFFEMAMTVLRLASMQRLLEALRSQVGIGPIGAERVDADQEAGASEPVPERVAPYTPAQSETGAMTGQMSEDFHAKEAAPDMGGAERLLNALTSQAGRPAEPGGTCLPDSAFAVTTTATMSAQAGRVDGDQERNATESVPGRVVPYTPAQGESESAWERSLRSGTTMVQHMRPGVTASMTRIEWAVDALDETLRGLAEQQLRSLRTLLDSNRVQLDAEGKAVLKREIRSFVNAMFETVTTSMVTIKDAAEEARETLQHLGQD
jgi:hypothetical protein